MNLDELDILSMEPNKVSTNLGSYNFLLYSIPGKGKTTTAINMSEYGKSFILGFEYGFKGIPGALGVAIPNYFALTTIVNKLDTDEARSKFDTIIIDTVTKAGKVVEEYILSQYGKTTVGDCKTRGGAFPLINRYWDMAFNRLKARGYNFIYICHSREVEIKDAEGNVINTKFEPELSDRLYKIVVPEVDYVFFMTDNKEGKRVLITDETPRNYAKRRTTLPLQIELNKYDVENLKDKFVEGIKLESGENITSERAKTTVVEFTPQEIPFEALIEEIKTIGKRLIEKGFVKESIEITNNALGTESDGSQRTLAQMTQSNSQMLENLLAQLINFENEKTQ